MIDNLEREREFLHFPKLLRGLIVDKKKTKKKRKKKQKKQTNKNICSVIFIVILERFS